MSELLMPSEAIRFTTRGDYACSWCGYVIPCKGDVLQEWCSAEVYGLFCSESHARGATNNVSYRAKWGF